MTSDPKTAYQPWRAITLGSRTLQCILSILLLVALFAPVVSAQTPVTDVFIMHLQEEVGVTVFGLPKRISIHEGYNNQPSFTPDGKSILFNADPNGNTDIFRYDIESDTTYQVTMTSVGEYSPTPTSNGTFVSVVVEPDGRQRLWEYDLDSGASKLYVSERDSVGYFDLLPDGQIPMFVLGTPPTLRIWNPVSKTERLVEGTPSRSIRKHPLRNSVVFVDTSRPDRNLVVEVDLLTLGRKAIAQMPDGAQDILIAPDGTLYASSGSVLYAFSTEADGVWKAAIDLRNFGLSSISRMAVSPDGRTFALVSVFTPVPPLDE